MLVAHLVVKVHGWVVGLLENLPGTEALGTMVAAATAAKGGAR